MRRGCRHTFPRAVTLPHRCPLPSRGMPSGLCSHQGIMKTSIHPCMNIVRGKIGSHPTHSSPAFIKRHLYGVFDSFG